MPAGRKTCRVNDPLHHFRDRFRLIARSAIPE
jgi:hypothetical protein